LLESHDELSSTDEKFVPLLDRELDKIVAFYKSQEADLIAEVEELAANIIEREAAGIGPDARYMDEDESDDEEEEGSVGLDGSLSQLPDSPQRRKRSLSGRGPRSGSTGNALQCRSLERFWLMNGYRPTGFEP
jgi:phosphate transporter